MGGKTIEDGPVEVEGGNNDAKEMVNVVLGIDPRSPTVEFNRTPIIVGVVAKENLPKLQNKNLDNVRKTEIQTTPLAAEKKSKLVPPKLLSTSPVSVVTNYKRKSFVGLLETNVDFTETDLDNVYQAKAKLNGSLPIEVPEDLPYNKLKSQMEVLQINSEKDTCDKSEQDIPLQKFNTKISEEKEINVTAQVKDFDKKLTNLIYQDDSEDDKLVLRVAKAKEGNRTPLGIRNSNEDNKKAANRLKVSDKPRKSESRIPVLKGNKKIGSQCENTPPLITNETKHKISRWDADKTMII